MAILTIPDGIPYLESLSGASSLEKTAMMLYPA